MTLYDKNHRPIEVGDVLKVFHFIGKRNKKYYMYKYVYDKVTYPAGHTLYHILHLDSNPEKLLESRYYLKDEDELVLEDYEIVQGAKTVSDTLQDVEDRKKVKGYTKAENYEEVLKYIKHIALNGAKTNIVQSPSGLMTVEPNELAMILDTIKRVGI